MAGKHRQPKKSQVIHWAIGYTFKGKREIEYFPPDKKEKWKQRIKELMKDPAYQNVKHWHK